MKLLKRFFGKNSTDDLIAKRYKLLPAWFTGRMMNDEWAFGLMLNTGEIIAIDCIENIHQDAGGNIWLDVRMSSEVEPLLVRANSLSVDDFIRPHTYYRLTATVNASQVIWAFELTAGVK